MEEYNVWNRTAGHWALEKHVATRAQAQSYLNSILSDDSTDDYEVRPVVATEGVRS